MQQSEDPFTSALGTPATSVMITTPSTPAACSAPSKSSAQTSFLAAVQHDAGIN
jgi:hypothetical protein